MSKYEKEKRELEKRLFELQKLWAKTNDTIQQQKIEVLISEIETEYKILLKRISDEESILNKMKGRDRIRKNIVTSILFLLFILISLVIILFLYPSSRNNETNISKLSPSATTRKSNLNNADISTSSENLSSDNEFKNLVISFLKDYRQSFFSSVNNRSMEFTPYIDQSSQQYRDFYEFIMGGGVDRDGISKYTPGVQELTNLDVGENEIIATVHETAVVEYKNGQIINKISDKKYRLKRNGDKFLIIEIIELDSSSSSTTVAPNENMSKEDIALFSGVWTSPLGRQLEIDSEGGLRTPETSIVATPVRIEKKESLIFIEYNPNNPSSDGRTFTVIILPENYDAGNLKIKNTDQKDNSNQKVKRLIFVGEIGLVNIENPNGFYYHK